MTYHEVTGGLTPADGQSIEARRLTTAEVAAAYHIPASLLSGEGGSYASVVEYRKSLYQDVLGPWFERLTQTLEAQVVPHFQARRVYLEFLVASKLATSLEEQAAILQTATGGPWMTRNEARARANLPQIDGADQLIVPLNVLEGGQASPTDPANARGV